jgi:hypothetical protein
MMEKREIAWHAAEFDKHTLIKYSRGDLTFEEALKELIFGGSKNVP